MRREEEEKKKKKILFVDLLSWGLPASNFWINNLSKNEYYVSYLGSVPLLNKSFLNNIHKNTYKTYTYKIQEYKNTNIIKSYINIIRLYLKFIKISNKYDYIIFRWLNFPLVDIIICYFLRDKIIYLCDNHNPHNDVKRNLLSFQFKSKIYFLPHIILSSFLKRIWFASKFTMDQYKNLYDTHNISTQLFHHGVFGMKSDSVELKFKKDKYFSKLVFLGLVRKYKGVEKLLDISIELSKSNASIKLEIYGKWDKNLNHLKNKFLKNKTKVVDSFLDESECEKILKPENLFLLPYQAATQSGIFYNLLFYGCFFLSTDIGENGYLLRKNNLSCLLTNDFSLKSINAKIDFIQRNKAIIAKRLYSLRDSIKFNMPEI